MGNPDRALIPTKASTRPNIVWKLRKLNFSDIWTVFRNQFYLVLVLASLSLVEADGAHWLIETELNKIGYGKRVQIFKLRHSLGLHILEHFDRCREVHIAQINNFPCR